jgi:hypothetical protein
MRSLIYAAAIALPSTMPNSSVNINRAALVASRQ